MKTTAVIPCFGSNRLLAHKVGEQLAGCEWVGVIFAGGMSELLHIDARTIVVNDLHRHVMNLAMAIACPERVKLITKQLDGLPFHLDVLRSAQARCYDREQLFLTPEGSVDWAVDYFVASWMGRNGMALRNNEFNTGLSIRWEAGGGDSAVRFRSATESIKDWHEIMRRCTFTCLDCFEFLDNCKDLEGHGIYSDAPWPDLGKEYKHKFRIDEQRRLAERLAKFQKARVVIRYGNHPLVQELYPRDLWHWIELEGRTQTNKLSDEVLIVNSKYPDGMF